MRSVSDVPDVAASSVDSADDRLADVETAAAEEL